MINASQRGAWAESMAAAWLLERGHEVFLGIGNPSCDFISMKDGVTQRVEVKSASIQRSRVKYAVTGCDPSRYDMLLVVLPDGTVLCNPTMDVVYQGRRQPPIRERSGNGRAPRRLSSPPAGGRLHDLDDVLHEAGIDPNSLDEDTA